ncbi:MAG TPA: CoA transferase, partial [Acidimicrobiales bacterium]|nr:CoA transferase [Acidimicrobiales bacterium]
MPETLLHGLRVLDLAGEPAEMAGRILADLGAEVVRVEPAAHAASTEVLRSAAWCAGKTRCALSDGDPELDGLLAGAAVVIDTPGWPGTLQLDPSRAPGAVWVSVTPFGLSGPRAGWLASDLGVMAASGNMYPTGDPDRPPVRCSEPAAYAHVGPETAMAALTALASGRPQRVDVSAQEAVLVANMCGPGAFVRTGSPGARRGPNTGRTREIWRCLDGYVSFGLRGGRARVPSLRTITGLVEEEGLSTPELTGRDW